MNYWHVIEITDEFVGEMAQLNREVKSTVIDALVMLDGQKPSTLDIRYLRDESGRSGRQVWEARIPDTAISLIFETTAQGRIIMHTCTSQS